MGDIFGLLNEKVASIAKKRFKKPTTVQELAIPKILEGKNSLVIAPTGVGKTESVLLPIFSKLVENKHKPIAVLYITPLKSLNRDLLDRIAFWSQKLEFGVTVRHGDTTQHERKLQVEHPDELFITTPEQIQAMLTGKRLRELLSNIKYIIVDELHELITSKRGIQLNIALERLKQLCSPQIIALSATIGSPKKAAEFLGCEEIIKAITAKDLEIKVESPFPNKKDKELAEKVFIGSEVAARIRYIYELMNNYRSVLSFTNTREAAEILSSRLHLLDKAFPHDVHHSSLSKEVRIRAEKDFKQEKLKAIIATSSLELGIDIGSIDLVIQYMSPRQVTKLTQRIGRSGHSIHKKSLGILITGDGDDVFESSVISRKALAGELEKIYSHKNSLDVLAHQIIGLTMEEYGIDLKKVFSIIKKANSYISLSEKEFSEVIKLLEQLRLIWLDDGKIKRTRKAFEYYFSNLSTIPDSYQYRVINIVSNQAVGSVDEQFIVSHGSGNFIVKGVPWKIISIENNKVYVEPIEDIESSVPAWEGELIPVPFDVAKEVEELRIEIGEMIERNMKNSEMIEKIKEKYPISSQTASKMIHLIKKQFKKYPVPKDILFEKHFKEFDYVIMHSCFGTKVNETIARFVSTILSAEYGSAVATRVDPYRIIFKGVSLKDVKKVLFEYNPEDIEVILKKSLPRTSLFKWKFIFVAKRFGVIAKQAKYDKINIDRIIDAYWDSPVYKETLREIFLEKLDIEKTKEILRRIQNKELKISEINGLSPLAELGFRYELSDVSKPERAEAEIFKMFKKRLLETKVRLVCVNCGKYSVTKKVEELSKNPLCRVCGSRLIGVTRPQDNPLKIIKKWLNGKTLTNDEEKYLERIKRTSDLTINYGKNSVICLAGRGVGPDTSFRILAKNIKTEEDLLKEIYKAEKQFIATKRFWS